MMGANFLKRNECLRKDGTLGHVPWEGFKVLNMNVFIIKNLVLQSKTNAFGTKKTCAWNQKSCA
jgi:hypothetical protein